MKLIDTSYHMEEFEFMRSHYQRALYNLLSIAKTNHQLGKISHSESGNNSPSPSTAAASMSPPVYPKVPSINLDLEFLSQPESVLEWSRYANEFVELEFIARGGFGQVYKARHKLDDTLYAVKKIHLRYQNANGFLRSLREVKMLACLNHPNIVAYKAAWLEPFDNRSSSSSVKHDRARNAAILIDENTESPIGCETDDSSDIVFEKSKSATSVADKPNASKDSSVFTSDSSSSPASNLAVCKYGENVNKVNCAFFMRNSLKHDWATLYVQMQLCEENMREWLDRRNLLSSLTFGANDHDVCGVVDIDRCLSVFISVLKGIEYIHDKGIVHHDIKPSNIFVSKDLRQVQVGDFGLACCLLTHTAVPLVQQQSSKHEGRIGTKLYAAPEQINGVCSPKSDIYSCGIILLELIRPFQTEMERSKIISHLKHGQIPTDVTAKWPHLVKIISETVATPVSKRPTASELLAAVQTVNCFGDRSFSSSSYLPSVTDSIIYKKDEIIFRLKEEIAAKDQEILRLKQQLGTRHDVFCKPEN